MPRFKKYTCDYRYFQTIDTEAKAYWLGFVAADGYIINGKGACYFGMCLGQLDHDHLAAFKQAIGATHPLESREDTVQYKQYDHTTVLKNVKIRISSKDLVADLAALGVVPKKSLSLPFPSHEQVPPHLLRHYVRGYFDGDGSIWRTKGEKYDKWGFNVLAPNRFCSQLFAVLVRETKRGDWHFIPHAKTKGMAYLSAFSYKTLAAVRDYLYKDATIYLVRKRAKFAELPDKTEPDTDICLREIPLLLARTEGEQNSKQIHEGIKTQFPSIQWLTVQVTLKRLVDDGFITVSRTKGRTKFYIYDNHEAEHDQCHPKG